MCGSENDENEAEFEAFRKQRTEFFALIGHCITEYQKAEDYLPQLFAARSA
jgi:hypothetical protein